MKISGVNILFIALSVVGLHRLISKTWNKVDSCNYSIPFSISWIIFGSRRPFSVRGHSQRTPGKGVKYEIPHFLY